MASAAIFAGTPNGPAAGPDRKVTKPMRRALRSCAWAAPALSSAQAMPATQPAISRRNDEVPTIARSPLHVVMGEPGAPERRASDRIASRAGDG